MTDGKDGDGEPGCVAITVFFGASGLKGKREEIRGTIKIRKSPRVTFCKMKGINLPGVSLLHLSLDLVRALKVP